MGRRTGGSPGAGEGANGSAGSHERDERDVQDEADDQVGEVKLKLTPKVIPPLAHLRHRRAHCPRSLQTHLIEFPFLYKILYPLALVWSKRAAPDRHRPSVQHN